MRGPCHNEATGEPILHLPFLHLGGFELSLWEAFGCSFLISLLLTAALRHWAPRLGLVDQPDPRKVHTQPTPRGGGLAIYAALVITAWLVTGVPERKLFTLFVVGLVIVLLGLLDDLRPLPWQSRLGVQTVAALVVVCAWPVENDWLFRGLAVLWIVGLINAFNMLDNMDALSGGVAWIVAAGLAWVVVLRPEAAGDWTPSLPPYLMFMGALSGFLWFNRPPARIFMGDAGSTFLGLFLGVRSLEDNFVEAWHWRHLVVLLCILAVPWYDLTSVVVLRLWQGRSPFHADKQHLSHRLVALGLSSPMAVRVIYLFALASAAAGLLLDQLPMIGSLLLGVQVACCWLAIAAVEYFRHFRSTGVQNAERDGPRDDKRPVSHG